jgi:hypothetical protein
MRLSLLLLFVSKTLHCVKPINVVLVPASPQVTAPPIRSATSPPMPEPFMENGPPAAGVSGQSYLRAGTQLDGTDAYLGRHTALEKLGPLGGNSLEPGVEQPSDDLNRQDTLQWIYGSKEAVTPPPPLQPAEDPNYEPDKIIPPMKPSLATETGAWFTDSSNLKIDNNVGGLKPITNVPNDQPTVQPSTLPPPLKEAPEEKSFGSFDTFGHEDDGDVSEPPPTP